MCYNIYIILQSVIYKGGIIMLLVLVIFICSILIGLNVFYTTDESEEKIEVIESELKKIKNWTKYKVITWNK